MPIEALKFTPADFVGNDISSLPDDPSSAGYTAAQMKMRFDRVAKNMIALGNFNELIDLLAGNGAAELGAAISGFDGATVAAVIEEMRDNFEGEGGAELIGTHTGRLQTVLDGMVAAIDKKQDTLTIDDAPTLESRNPVSSDALARLFAETPDIDSVLCKDNSEEFDPTGPYNPATKKYVDDKIISAGAGNVMCAELLLPAGRMLGDVDGDGFITQADWDLLDAAVKKTVTLEGDDLLCADINGDGKTAAADRVLLGYYLDGTKPESFVDKLRDCGGTWIFEKQSSKGGRWYTDISVSGMTAESDVFIFADTDSKQTQILSAECLDGAIRIYVSACPVNDIKAAAFFSSGGGTAVALPQKAAADSIVSRITLSDTWTAGIGEYTQTVGIVAASENSRIDIQPDAIALATLSDSGTSALYITNEAGVFTAHAVSAAPKVEIELQISITEVRA